MTKQKQQLSNGIGVRLPEQLVLELEECAAKQERSLSQEIRYRLVQSSSTSDSRESNKEK